MKTTSENNDGNNDPNPWMNTYEACQYLRISKPTIYRWIQAGLLKFKRTPGGELRFRRSDLDNMLE